ncbi:MAG: ABC transporter permease [Chloroflexota bacterium]
MRFLAPRWRKVIRDMWQNKARTFLVVMSIAVGIFAIGVVTGAQRVFLSALNESYGGSNPASGRVIISGEFSDDLVETVDSMREVAIAEGRRQASVNYRLLEADEWQGMSLVTAANFEEVEIQKVIPKEGVWPPSDKELLLELTSLEWLGVEVGETVTFETSEGKIRTMQIVGTVRYQDGPPASVTGTPTGFVTRDTLEWLNESRDFTELVFTVAENPLDREHIEAVGELIRKKIENSGLEVIFIRVPPPGEHPLNTILQPLLLVLTGLGVLALALSGFLVVNIISAILSQQTRQIGIMKSIGGRRGQIMSLYFTTVFVYGFLALVIAIPLGAYGGWQLTLFMADFFNVEVSGFSVSRQVMVMQAAIAILIPVLASLFPIISGTRITVREAISDYGLGSGRFGKSLIDRLLQKFRGLSRPLMISLRNTFRRKTRLSLTLLTLTLAGTTFITIYSVRDSMLSTLENVLSLWQFDVNINLEEAYRFNELEQVIAPIEGVEAVEGWGFTSVRRLRPDGTESDNVTLTAPIAETQMLNPTLLEGRWLTPNDTNALVIDTDFLQDEPDVKVGDQIVLQLGSKKTSWRVVGLIQGTTIGSSIYTNYTYFARLVSEVNKTRLVRINSTNQTPAAQETLAQALEIELDEAGFDVARLDTISELRSRVESGFNFLLTFLLSMALILAVVGGLGLSGTMSINVIERVREIGVMRAVGASDWTILKIVLIEGLVIGGLSWAAGGLLAWPLSLITSNLLGYLLLENPLQYVYSAFGLTLWLLVALGLAIIASYLPARGASRLTVREVLAYE